MMKVLVLGGAGYIGSAVVRHLEQHGHRVAVIDNLSKGHRAALPDSDLMIHGDLGDASLVTQVCQRFGIEVAMHFAAFTEVGESVQRPDAYYDNNVIRTKVLLDTLRGVGVNRFVFSSTAAVFGDAGIDSIPEDAPKRPTSPYGWSKLMVEEILRSYGTAFGLKFAILRYFNACGASDADHGEDHRPESHLIPLVLQVALGQRASISVFGNDWPTADGTCIRDYVHVSDLAAAHEAAARRLVGDGESGDFNLGSGQGFSVLEVIESARRVTGHPIPVVIAARRAGDPPRLVAHSSRARDVLGWRPEFEKLDDIIASAWAWQSRHPRGYEKS